MRLRRSHQDLKEGFLLKTRRRFLQAGNGGRRKRTLRREVVRPQEKVVE